MITAGPEAAPAEAEAVNAAMVWPGGTITSAGMARAELDEWRAAAEPPAGAGWLSVSWQTAACPAGRFAGVQERETS